MVTFMMTVVAGPVDVMTSVIVESNRVVEAVTG